MMHIATMTNTGADEEEEEEGEEEEEEEEEKEEEQEGLFEAYAVSELDAGIGDEA